MIDLDRAHRVGIVIVPKHNVVGRSELRLQMCRLGVFCEGRDEAGRQFAFDDVAQLDCDRLQDEDRLSHVALFSAAAIRDVAINARSHRGR